MILDSFLILQFLFFSFWVKFFPIKLFMIFVYYNFFPFRIIKAEDDFQSTRSLISQKVYSYSEYRG